MQPNIKQRDVNGPMDCIRVEISGDIGFYSREAYAELVLRLSTGDFHTHTARIAYLNETDSVYHLVDGEMGVYGAYHFNFYLTQLTLIKGDTK